jgi:murein DD-endopeptidase MepM/ murein hydrolase activator NlpD
MKYKFMTQPLLAGIYEPEGIYLSTPFDGACPVLQFWGQHPDHYAQFKYNGVPLKGHIGIDFGMEPGSAIFAVDNGRVMEISSAPGDFERYIKLEHWWGESFYALLGEIGVEAGQVVKRNEYIARTGRPRQHLTPHLHFGVRILPYNRFDGWGGFADPLPFLNPNSILLPDHDEDQGADAAGQPLGMRPPIIPLTPHPMAAERPGMRRP